MLDEIKYGVTLPTEDNPWRCDGYTTTELREIANEADTQELSVDELLGDQAIIPAVLRQLADALDNAVAAYELQA